MKSILMLITGLLLSLTAHSHCPHTNENDSNINNTLSVNYVDYSDKNRPILYGACNSDISTVTLIGDVIGSPITILCKNGEWSSKAIWFTSPAGLKSFNIEQYSNNGNTESTSFTLETKI